jgi:hypothetical protein
MLAAIIGGLPPDLERRVRVAIGRGTAAITDEWTIIWMPSKGRLPGLAPSQITSVLEKASDLGGAHVLIFRGGAAEVDAVVVAEIAPYFRVRWLDKKLLTLIPYSIGDFSVAITEVLKEELEWNSAVKPQDESCCLLLPECAFVANDAVKHLWAIAAQPGIERIRGAALASEKFKSMHWLRRDDVRRVWIDQEGKAFDYHGQRHGVAPFPRSWKFSYQLPVGLHFDVTATDSRAFKVFDWDKNRHAVSGSKHVNIDPHGYVRSKSP